VRSSHRKAAAVVTLLCLLVVAGYVVFWNQIDKNQQVPESQVIVQNLEKTGELDFEAPDLFGQKIKLHDFLGRIVILNFWASWCGPCVQEFPSLINLAKKVPQVEIVAISSDHDRASLNAFLKAFKMPEHNFSILLDPNRKISELYGTEILPESFVFSKSGQFVRKIIGAEKWDQPDAIQFFKDQLLIQ
jgi:thiol-disulfide isomerase/thioredoxin